MFEDKTKAEAAEIMGITETEFDYLFMGYISNVIDKSFAISYLTTVADDGDVVYLFNGDGSDFGARWLIRHKPNELYILDEV